MELHDYIDKLTYVPCAKFRLKFVMPGDDTEILGANNPTQPTTPNHPPKPNQPLVNQLEVLEPSLGLDLIDSQSSLDFIFRS